MLPTEHLGGAGWLRSQRARPACLVVASRHRTEIWPNSSALSPKRLLARMYIVPRSVGRTSRSMLMLPFEHQVSWHGAVRPWPWRYDSRQAIQCLPNFQLRQRFNIAAAVGEGNAAGRNCIELNSHNVLPRIFSCARPTSPPLLSASHFDWSIAPRRRFVTYALRSQIHSPSDIRETVTTALSHISYVYITIHTWCDF